MKIVTREQVQDGKKYIVTLNDCYGDYTQEVTAKFYKPGSHENQLKAVYRFIDEYNRIILKHHTTSIAEVDNENSN